MPQLNSAARVRLAPGARWPKTDGIPSAPATLMRFTDLLLLAFFNHPAMLGWLLAAAAPLIIHLLNRRRHRQMEWAAMQYLLAAVQKHARRIRVEQWLLLVVRVTLIVLVVLALADPFLAHTGLKFVASGERVHKVFVVDASYSMTYRAAETSRFERAQQMAAQIVGESHQGDGFSLVLLSSPPRAVVGTPTFDRQEFLQEIESLRPLDAGADLPAALAKVEGILAAARNESARLAREEVYIFSDLARNTWLPESRGRESLADFRQLSQRLAASATLVLADLGEDDAENQAVVALRVAAPFVTPAREVTFEADVHNFGRQDRPRQLIELLVDGRGAGENHLDVAAGETQATTFSYRFDAPGEHQVEVRLAGDSLAVDDHRWLALPVVNQLRVLCVNGKPAGDSFQGATDYLMVALAPGGPTDDRSLVLPEVVTERSLLEIELAQYDCVILANVAQFTASEARLLNAYVRDGGGLIFFLGDQVQADNYNQQLAAGGEAVNLLPARLGDLAPLNREPPYLFNPLGYQHPIVAPFRGRDRAGLLTTPVYEYVKATVPKDSSARVALAYGNGDPAIVEKRVGRGRSILVTTSADASWSAWPVWLSYLPIVQELVAEAVRGKVGQRNLRVGQALDGESRSAPSEGIVSVTTPSGETRPVRLTSDGGLNRWSFGEPEQSGMYRVEFGPPLLHEQFFAVNVDPGESDLTKIAPDELRDEVWPGVPFEPFGWQASPGGAATPTTRRDSLHRWLLLAALALLLTETALACWLGRRSAQ